ncbi:YerC/YecD family TrpR-related protein [Maricaulis sp. D1M11]|uniref:YerC/YecD family TrpR-related protein n=1 Tax=Maricaulis sp. D1M11 TaxID=3076117 RepID=UPI0039B4D6D6
MSDAHASNSPDMGPLVAAVLSLRDETEAERFLRDLLTPGEIKTLTERWRVAGLLDEGGYSYREISEMTGASTTTVTRVARFLSQEPHQGYRLILNRLKEAGS